MDHHITTISLSSSAFDRRPSTMRTVITIHLVHNSCSSTPWTNKSAMTSLSSLPFSCSTLRVKRTIKTTLQSPFQPNFYRTSQSIKYGLAIFSRFLGKTPYPAVSQSFFFGQLFISASTSSNQWASSQQIVHRHTLQPMARRGFLPRQGSQSTTSHSYWAVLPQLGTFGQRNYCWVDIISTKCIVGGLQWRSSLGFSMYYRYGFQSSTSLAYPS